MVQRKWGKAEDEELLRLHGEGLPANQIRKRMGWALETVQRHSKRLGLSYDRSMMVAAIEATKADHKVRRRNLAQQWLTILEQQTERLIDVDSSKPFETVQKQMGGIDVDAAVSFIPPSDLRLMSQALSSLSTALANLEKLDQDGGLGEARGLVGSLLGLLRVSVEGEERLNPTGEVASA